MVLNWLETVDQRLERSNLSLLTFQPLYGLDQLVSISMYKALFGTWYPTTLS